MAEEKTEEGSAPPGTGKKMVLLIVLGVAVLAGGGGAAWLLLGSNDTAHETRSENPSQESSHDAHANEPGPIVELDPFVLNLADKEELRYLKLTISLELDRPKEETDFEARLPAIRDALLVLLTSKESRAIRTVSGKRRIREEIRSRVNKVMRKGKVTNVFFTDFIIQ